MKHIYILLLLTLIAVTASSQRYYISTAKKSGNWSASTNWTIASRTDGKKLNSVIIPAGVKISLDKDYDLSGGSDMEISVSGTLNLKKGNSLILSAGSRIDIVKGGKIQIDAAVNPKNDKHTVKIIVGNTEKFNSSNEEQIEGSAFASQITGASPSGFSANAILPVNFVSFNVAKANDAMIAINWSTSDEINNSHFEIQRSVDGVNWTGIAMMFPETDGGNLHLYKYNDKYDAAVTVYYRIRQVDFDGKEKYSAVRMIGGSKAQMETRIYVSAKNTVTVDLKYSVDSKVTVRLISMNGAVVSQKASNLSGEKISLSAYNAAPGAYVVQVADMKGMITSKKVLL